MVSKCCYGRAMAFEALELSFVLGNLVARRVRVVSLQEEREEDQGTSPS